MMPGYQPQRLGASSQGRLFLFLAFHHEAHGARVIVPHLGLQPGVKALAQIGGLQGRAVAQDLPAELG